MSVLRQKNRLYRRPVVEMLEDRRPISESLRPIAALVAAAGVAQAAILCVAPPSNAESPQPVVAGNNGLYCGAGLDPAQRAEACCYAPRLSTDDPATIGALDAAFAQGLEPVAAQHTPAGVTPSTDHAPAQADGPDASSASAGSGSGFTPGAGGPLSASPGNNAAAGPAGGVNPSASIPPSAAPHTVAPTATQAPMSLAVPAAAVSSSAPAAAASAPAPAGTGAGQPATPAAQPVTGSTSSSLYFGGDLLQSVAGTSAPQPSAFSSNPVQYGTGIAAISFTDLPSDNSGLPTGLTRGWTNGSGYSTGLYGSGMVFTQLPQPLQGVSHP